ncbi:MAG: DUF4430 domain-containing protein [Clostridia bacterium]|nr:DUF4430 domain-containing protein [Clostridia bacterium]
MRLKSILALLLVILLVGCGQADAPQLQSDTEIISIGEGETSFILTVTDREGAQTAYQVHTDCETVGKALVELKLIDGEPGPYGMYVKTVAGTTVDYNKDGKYWAFYHGDTYATSGVDATKISEGETYSFRVE